MRLGEVFGTRPADQSEAAKAIRHEKMCPFRSTACTKDKKDDPLGVCTLETNNELTVVCPVRFIQEDRIFRDAGDLAFGMGTSIAVFPEYKLLEIMDGSEKIKKIGKVDFLIGKVDSGHVTDFCALEIQAVYSSGGGVRDSFKSFIANEDWTHLTNRLGVDFRSSAQKRLFPQLSLKVPIFRRWGKKFFVVVDHNFFNALPGFPKVSQGNSEITWLTYRFHDDGTKVQMSAVAALFTEWDAVSNALREGTPPASPEAVISELDTILHTGMTKMLL